MHSRVRRETRARVALPRLSRISYFLTIHEHGAQRTLGSFAFCRDHLSELSSILLPLKLGMGVASVKWKFSRGGENFVCTVEMKLLERRLEGEGGKGNGEDRGAGIKVSVIRIILLAFCFGRRRRLPGFLGSAASSTERVA